MNEPHDPTPDERARVARLVRDQVGAIFRTVRRGQGICEVCAGPASGSLCGTCSWHRDRYGDRLADLVVPVAYAVRGQQSGHHMYGYKGDRSSSEDNLRDVKFLARGAAYLHRNCIVAEVGRPWAAATFVCSQNRPGAEHPVSQIGDQVVNYDDASLLYKFQIETGPSIAVDRRDGPLPDRFVLPEPWKTQVDGQHVLVVDDTWVSGRNSQSVAIACKDAGASEVTILCAARWLDRAYGGHPELIDRLPPLFDALSCPVTGGACPQPLPVAGNELGTARDPLVRHSAAPSASPDTELFPT
jgi:hypothetical protein